MRTLVIAAVLFLGCGGPTYRHEEGKFDRGDAARALGQASVAAKEECRTPAGPGGELHIKVKFEPDGAVSETTIDEGYDGRFPKSLSFRGTPRGDCVERIFRAARVRPFHHGPVTVGKAVTLE